jgi:hypothetical protein
MVRTTQPYWSEGTLLYLESFNGGEAGKNDKGFHEFAGTEEKDIHQGEDWIGEYALMRREQESRMRENLTYGLRWQGMEKYYGKPKRARNWKRWIQPR